MTAPLSIKSVSRHFGAFTALDQVSLDIAAGEFIVLLGPSGCGKTTLLSILGGFLAPSSGRIEIGGRDMTFVAPAKRPTTTMFQDYALFPHMTLLDNVGFGPRMAGATSAARDAIALEKLRMVGLVEAAAKKPHQLSGGQRQRVALARALAVEPDVLLLDEPLGALDLKLRRQMQDELKAIQRRLGTTFIHVTHDQEEAMAIADRIVVMNQGRIEDDGAPDRIYLRPRSLFAAGFMGEVNFIAGTIETATAEMCRVATAFGVIALPPEQVDETVRKPGARVTLALRPEAFRADPSAPTSVTLGLARIADAAFFGTHVRAHVLVSSAPDKSLVVHLPQGALPADGTEIELVADRGAIMALAAKEG